VDVSKSNKNFVASQMPSAYNTMDVCNLGSLSCSMDPEKLSESKGALETQNSDDDMCQIDNDFSTSEVKLGPLLTSNDFNKVSNCFDIIIIAGVAF